MATWSAWSAKLNSVSLIRVVSFHDKVRPLLRHRLRWCRLAVFAGPSRHLHPAARLNHTQPVGTPYAGWLVTRSSARK